MEHWVVVRVPWMYAVAVGMVDIMNIRVRGACLGVVGPGVREGGGSWWWRWEAGLGEDVSGPE